MPLESHEVELTATQMQSCKLLKKGLHLLEWNPEQNHPLDLTVFLGYLTATRKMSKPNF